MNNNNATSRKEESKPRMDGMYILFLCVALTMSVQHGIDFFNAVQTAGGLSAIREDLRLLPLSEAVYFSLFFFLFGMFAKIHLKARKLIG